MLHSSYILDHGAYLQAVSRICSAAIATTSTGDHIAFQGVFDQIMMHIF
jgi:hypothetical protein